MKKILQRLGLTPENSIVIGSGILHALGIRQSKDIDVVVSQEVFDALKKSRQFIFEDRYGYDNLRDKNFDIRIVWNVFGKDYRYQDLDPESTIVDGVKYITLGFLYRVKKSWLEQGDTRQKTLADVKLIEKYQRP